MCEGAIAEINSANGSIISENWSEAVSIYRYDSLVATPTGAWLSAGGGGNGSWMDFFSASGLRPTREIFTIGWVDLFASGDVVWSSFTQAGLVSCFSASEAGTVHSSAVVTMTAPRQEQFLGMGYPFGIDLQRNSLLVGALDSNTLVAVLIPQACAARVG